MSKFSDNRSEMLGATISDEEIERFLSAHPSEDGGLTDLVPFVAMMRSYGTTSPSEAAIDRIATEAAATVRSQPSSSVVAPGTRRAQRFFRAQPKLATLALVAIVLFSGLTGVAVAANGAVPGDSLYGIDRALENFGIGSGHAEERLDEARTLVDRGQAKEALDHVAKALDEAEDDGEDITELEEARTALETAAQSLAGQQADDEQAVIVSDGMAALFQYLKENLGKDMGVDGKAFGQNVADLARGISDEERGPEGDVTNSTEPSSPSDKDEMGDPPGTTPGQGEGQENGQGNGQGNGAGNGPPDGSPSETAPGKAKKP